MLHASHLDYTWVFCCSPTDFFLVESGYGKETHWKKEQPGYKQTHPSFICVSSILLTLKHLVSSFNQLYSFFISTKTRKKQIEFAGPNSLQIILTKLSNWELKALQSGFHSNYITLSVPGQIETWMFSIRNCFKVAFITLIKPNFN